MPDVSAEHAQLLAGLLLERERAGLTTRQLAARVEAVTGGEAWSPSKVSRIETGRSRPTRPDVELWLRITGASEVTAQGLMALVDSVAVETKSWSKVFRQAGGAPARQGDYARWEREATRIVVFQPSIPPGLIQTLDYAHRLLQLNETPEDEIWATAMARTERSKVLYEPGRDVLLLITEAALRLRIAPASVLVEQLDRIGMSASLPNVRLGVIAMDAQVDIVPSSAFVFFDLPTEKIVTVELLTDEVEIVDPVQVARYERAVEQWERAAVFGAAATRLLARIRAGLTGDQV